MPRNVMGMKTPNAIMVSMQAASAQTYQGEYSPSFGGRTFSPSVADVSAHSAYT
jgi:hypothetical protein